MNKKKDLMPYYQCPKCSGRDTYEGTELVSGSTGGGAIIGPENDLGFSPVVGAGGSKKIDQVTVVKCKKCDIILGDKDLQYSENERKDLKIKKAEKDEAMGYFLALIVSAIVIIALFVYGYMKSNAASSMEIPSINPEPAMIASLV